MLKKEKKPKKQTLNQFLREVITRLIKPPIIWPREYKILKNLWIQYPNKLIWNSLPISNQLPSMAFFLTEVGKDYLRKTKLFVDYEIEDRSKNLPILGEKCGEDIEIKVKPKTIRDFLS